MRVYERSIRHSLTPTLSYSHTPLLIIIPRFQNGQKCFLRNVDAADRFHAALAFFLLFEQFALPRDVAAVAFGGHVLAQGRDRFASDDPAADRGLDRDFELM